MNRKEFLEMLFAFFNVKDEEKVIYKSYDLLLSKFLNVDWDKLYTRILEQSTSRFLPPVKNILELVPYCIKQTFKQVENDGNLVRIFFKSGRYTDYVVSGFGLNISKIRKLSPLNDNIREVRMYPKNVMIDGKNVQVALIGDAVYPEGVTYDIVYIRN